MQIINAKYLGSDFVSGNVAIHCEIGEQRFMTVPIDEENSHYQEIMRQVEAGTLTIQEAD